MFSFLKKLNVNKNRLLPYVKKKKVFQIQKDYNIIDMFILPTGSHFEDFDLDPKTHDAVKAFLNQEENECTQFVNQEEVTKIIYLQ